MKSFPAIRMVYTSDTIQGRVYIPLVNWVLMIGVIILIAAFSDCSFNSFPYFAELSGILVTALTNAYGFAVSTVMLSTSLLLAVHMKWRKHWPIVVPIAFFAVFGFVDALFFGAALKKVPHGAWVPLMIGTLLYVPIPLLLASLCKTDCSLCGSGLGRGQVILLNSEQKCDVSSQGLEDEFDGTNRQNLRHFISQETVPKLSNGGVEDDELESPPSTFRYYYLTADNQKHELTRIPTCAIFHKISQGKGVPHTFIGKFLRYSCCLPHNLH